jgi:hypothetical protein
MEFVFEVVVASGQARDWHDQVVRPRWARLAGIGSYDVYRWLAGEAKDPYVDDGAAPELMVVLAFSDASQLARAIASEDFQKPLHELPAGIRLAGATMERRFYPVAGEAAASPLRARFSYVVRYQLPAEDEAAFVTNYVATHPPTLARLPAIRNIICYFPLRLPNPAGLADPDYLIGNEVVFDDVAAFNHAMASPVRHELRAHFRQFPAFSGRNMHYPMIRTRLAG